MFRKMKMGTKIGLGFLLVTIALVIVGATTLVQVARTDRLTTELIERDQPMASESVRVLNGLNESLAALRGWILINNPRFKTERASAWTQAINPSIVKLKQHFTSSDAADDVGSGFRSDAALSSQDKVLLVEKKLEELEELQRQCEEIAQTDGNIPAVQIMKEATPTTDRIVAAVTAIIDEEAKLEATAERKRLLGQLANFRGSFIAGLASIRTFLITGQKSYTDDFREDWRTNQVSFDNIDSMEELLEGKQASEWASLKSARSNFAPMPDQMFDSRGSEDWNQAVTLLRDEAAPLAFVIRENLESLLAEDLQPSVMQKRNEVSRNTNALKTIVWTLMVVGVLFSAICGYLITSDFNRLGESIKSLLNQLSSSSQEISTASQEQVASMTESTTSINEISSTAEEFKATTQEFVDRSRAVREAAEEMANRATVGLGLTQSTALKNEEVRMSFEAGGESILKLSQQMQQITQITTSVTEIAEQTKLLALNASIEAARAGEEGRGFAVVATQVRELANQSKEASGRITAQINDIQHSVQTVIGKSEQGNEKLIDANQMGEQMAQAFQEIYDAIQQTTDAMRQMDQAAHQQGSGMSDLVNGISEVDAGSRQTLTTAQQTQQAIRFVDERANELRKIAAKLKN